MRNVIPLMLFLILILACQKTEDSEELFNKAEGFINLHMYKEALDIYIELKNRDYKTDIVEQRIKYVSTKIAEEKLKAEIRKADVPIVKEEDKKQGTISTTNTQVFKVSRCDSSYNERIEAVKNEMKPYQDELNEIEKKLSKITSEYKVVNVDGGYNFAVPADTPKEKQKEIAEGPAREFGTLNARKNELLEKINKFNSDIAKIIEESKKAGLPSDCIKR
ncbi:MAG: hypothetical protein ACP5QK_01470 [Myxococcota bacterium]